VVVVGVGAREGHYPAVADRFRHRRRVVRGVGHQHLALVAEQPHVVVHVEGLTTSSTSS